MEVVPEPWCGGIGASIPWSAEQSAVSYEFWGVDHKEVSASLCEFCPHADRCALLQLELKKRALVLRINWYYFQKSFYFQPSTLRIHLGRNCAKVEFSPRLAVALQAYLRGRVFTFPGPFDRTAPWKTIPASLAVQVPRASGWSGLSFQS